MKAQRVEVYLPNATRDWGLAVRYVKAYPAFKEVARLDPLTPGQIEELNQILADKGWEIIFVEDRVVTEWEKNDRR